MKLSRAFAGGLLILLVLFTMNSCFGVSAAISVRAGGSGTILLKYRVSQMAESLGRLDGNERWHTVPVGRADLSRSLDRIPGMRLKSFSEKNTGTDIVTRAEIEFKTIDALLAFLDGNGRYARFAKNGGSNRLTLVVLDGEGRRAANADADLSALLQELSQGYEVHISFTAPGPASLSLLDGEGKPADGAEAARLVSKGKTVSLTIGTGDLLRLSGGLGMEIEW
ncbi:MAG: hypothetical protein LBD48_04110 [Treponema sp.]|jgi:hypothetical protein|nr:hypothetical protein [Treponema sp.]